MKTVIKLFTTTCSLIIFYAWTTRQVSDIKKTEWLIGTWENKTARGTVYESWKKISATEFAGKSYRLTERDTVFFETIKLVQEEAGLFYIPTVANQNNAQPVRFTAKTVSANQMIFENPRHDYPQTISYTKTDSISLIAEISGYRNGQERKQIFPMKRSR